MKASSELMPEFLKGFYLEEFNYSQSLELMWVAVMGVSNGRGEEIHPMSKALSDAEYDIIQLNNENKDSFCNLMLSEPQWLEFLVWVSHHLHLKYSLETLSVELSNLKSS